MSLSLHAVIVPAWLQTLRAVAGLIDKARAFCVEHGLDESDVIEARLAPDMLPFAYQVKSVAVHSLGAIEGLRAGSFSPDTTPPPASFDALAARIEATISALEAIEPPEMDAFVGRDMIFAMRGREMAFDGEKFLFGFSNPNFYFHAATAYDVLRSKGVSVGKVDFLGRPPIRA